MPLDSHSYLVSQGWTGSGTGLRQGAISRPLAIPQKKTLAGLGKDRDEAFPFWDHLFSAASKSIQIKISDDGDDSDNSDSEPDASVSLKRTSTGILSNRRPVTGTTAENSGATTPADDTAPRLSLLATAKREAAKRGLYSRFFRGPVLGPDSPLAGEPAIVIVPDVVAVSLAGDADTAEEKPRKKKRKTLDREEEERRERKRLRKEKKEQKELKRQKKSQEKCRGKEREREENGAVPSNSDVELKKEKKRKRKQEAEAEVDIVDEESKPKRKQDEEKESEQSGKRRRKEEKRKSKESSEVQPEEQPKRKRKRPVE